MSYSGKTKIEFCRRLQSDWRDLADYFDIPSTVQASFHKGREPHGVWEWLEGRKRLQELPEALKYIDRADIVVEVLEPAPSPKPPLQMTWQGSPFPGLRHFTEADAPIFFGRNTETKELLNKIASHRFVVVIGASGSGKSSLVAAGVLPRLKGPKGKGQDHEVGMDADGQTEIDDPRRHRQRHQESLRAVGIALSPASPYHGYAFHL
jgi:hypothetical protein